MAQIQFEDEIVDVEDNSELTEPCMDFGIPFGCTSGACGTCRIDVQEGMENLTPKTAPEIDMELEGPERLACQCKIKQGKVKLDF